MRNVTERLNQYLRADNMEKVKRKYLELILGIVLLTPPVLSVLSILFIYVGVNILRPFVNKEIGASYVWIGYIYESGGFTPAMAEDNSQFKRRNIYESGGFTPALPLYFGLMAIAGAYLISHSTIKNNIKQ